MNFESEIEGPDGFGYHLGVVALYNAAHGKEQDARYFFIAISKLADGEKLPVGSLNLRYDLNTNTYKELDPLEGIKSLLFAEIIDALEVYCREGWRDFRIRRS